MHTFREDHRSERRNALRSHPKRQLEKEIGRVLYLAGERLHIRLRNGRTPRRRHLLSDEPLAQALLKHARPSQIRLPDLRHTCTTLLLGRTVTQDSLKDAWSCQHGHNAVLIRTLHNPKGRRIAEGKASLYSRTFAFFLRVHLGYQVLDHSLQCPKIGAVDVLTSLPV